MVENWPSTNATCIDANALNKPPVTILTKPARSTQTISIVYQRGRFRSGAEQGATKQICHHQYR